MGFGYGGPEAFVKDPSEAVFIADVLADAASDGSYPRRKAYAALRSLSPPELYEMYLAWREGGNEGFRQAFGPLYHQAAGETVDGPLFQMAGEAMR